MVSTVIVALPTVDDKVYRISSEKVPHLTMLYLGDETNTMDVPDIVSFVQHAAANLDPFYLTVDYRGTLGDNDADVIFFEDNLWEMPKLKTFRHQLLLNEAIRRSHDSTEQYPEWRPHLTLGYPDAPAREDDSDYPGLHSVRFDRLAVWFGDYEGPEIRLKYNEHAMEVAMSDISTTERGKSAVDELFHYGVKGMKWGVRNDKGHEGERVKTKKLGKLDKQWEKENTGVQGFIKVHNAVADRMNNGEIDRFNNEPRWKKAADDGVLADDNHPETKAYFDAYESLSNRMFAEEGAKLGSNPSGTKAYELREDADGNPYAYLAPVTGEVKHAEGDVAPGFKVNRSENGLIVSITDAKLELKHYGVKGMRWGVTTKDRATQTTPRTEVQVTQKKPGTYAKTKGGKDLPLNPDAAEALVLRQKARASTTDALSNKELQIAITRMNLEQQYQNLAFQTDRRSKGARFIAGLVGEKQYGKKRVFSDAHEELGDEIRKTFADARKSKG